MKPPELTWDEEDEIDRFLISRFSQEKGIAFALCWMPASNVEGETCQVGIITNLSDKHEFEQLLKIVMEVSEQDPIELRRTGRTH